MSLSHMESMPLSQSDRQGAQRSSWKPWLICSAIILLLLCSFSQAIVLFLPQQTAKEACVAKFGPFPAKWRMTSPEPPCVNKTSDGKLKVLQNGLYLIFGRVAFDTTYQGSVPLAIQLRRNEDILETLTSNSQIQILTETHELHAGDTIDLIFNSEDQVLKNDTYWGVLLEARLPFV
ncbi:tumor necrosis factor ligand superfamily member 18 [Perognathus longimembris pacificus]|uniref:tumor necrosis factor ligand superfamily member 18 n=1 Tax=Perognathus longimembris pacificus TaxID=214514 RepID=UPI00201894FC|nr:tumor necrosis factor ligand superfamily member 18 [Perognathus longimembris pacificus]